MWKKALSILAIASFTLMLFVPLVANAQLNTNNPDTTLSNRLFGCTTTPGGGSGIMCIITNILRFILAIAFIVAVIFLVVGGFRYIVSQGNEEAVEKAKSTITSAIIGIVVIVLAWIILTIIVNLTQSGSATGGGSGIF